MTSPLALLLAFAAGVIVGMGRRDAFTLARSGKVLLVTDARTILRSASGSRRLGITLVTIALVAQSIVGVLALASRERSIEATRDATAAAESAQAAADANAATSAKLGALLDCLERYNRAAGLARDERDAKSKTATTYELDLWKKIRDVIASTAEGGSDVAIQSIDAYIASVRELQDTRAENPYPDPATCATLDK